LLVNEPKKMSANSDEAIWWPKPSSVKYIAST
jgi:hypothetical protein